MNKIKVHLTPSMDVWPPRGGVREHLRQFAVHAHVNPVMQLVDSPDDADILHVESAYSVPETSSEKPIVYVCHGGFVPSPLTIVIRNLIRATVVVSVADWIVKDFFPPKVISKTTVIPNGVALHEFDDLDCTRFHGLDSFKDEVYVLYGKEGPYYMDDYYSLIDHCSRNDVDVSFVSLVEDGQTLPHWKFHHIGLQPKDVMNCVIKNASILMMTGSEVCPTMLLEAWACGVPVLAKNMHGNTELMTRNGQSPVPIGGALYDSIDMLPDCLEMLLDQGHRLGEMGRCEVEASYQWSDIINRYIAVYERLA